MAGDAGVTGRPAGDALNAAMTRTLRAILILAALTALPAAAAAGVSDWVDNPGGRMRLVVLPPDGSGTVKGAVEIEPARGWITYWREPGEAGMPPQITIAPESSLALEALRFPAPDLFEQNGVRDIGYDGPVSLPFTLKAKGAAERLKAEVFIGVCKEICVPFQAAFDLPLKGDEAEAGKAIAAAEARLPEGPSADFHAEKPRIGADGSTVSVEIALPAPGAAEFYLTGPDGYVYLDPALESAGPGRTRATFTLDELPRGYDLTGKTWRLLVKSGGRTMETALVFD